MSRFLLHVLIVLLVFTFLFIMRKHHELSIKKRIVYYILAILCVFIILMKGIFALNPALEAMWMPITIYSRIDRTYSFLCFLIFLALISVIAPQKDKKAIYSMIILFSIYIIYLPAWRLTTPICYTYKGVMKDGVCIQSSPYTCGASAAVTLLSEYKINSTEGEMARLTETIPFKGVSNFQAVVGLNRKLTETNNKYSAVLTVYRDDQLSKIKTPCLAAIKYSFFFDHMICILNVDNDFVEIADPLKGKRSMSRKLFLEQWRNVNIEIKKKKQ